MNLFFLSAGLLAPVFLVVFFILLLVFSGLAKKQRRELREIPGFLQLRKVVGQAVEAGSRLQIALGSRGLYDQDGASALAGLTILQRIAQAASISDSPPIATSGDSQVALLSQDTLQTAYRSAKAENLYNPLAGRLAGVTPLSYAAGAMAAIHDEQVSATIVLGHVGGEVGLLTAATEQTRGQSLGGSDNLSGQSVLYMANQEPIIGEEIFAGGAYLSSNPSHHASLQVQDIARWVVIVAILLGAVARMVGLL